MSVFQAIGYKVTFVPVDNFLFQSRYTEPLHRRGVECLYAPFELSLEMHLAEHGEVYDVIHVFRHGVLERCAPALSRYCPNALVLLNNMDLHFLRRERQASVEGNTRLAKSAEKEKRRELATMAKADVACVPSTLEQDVLKMEGFAKPVVLMPYMVDLRPPRAAWADRSHLLFLGGFNHPPNIDAVGWLIEEIWPLAKERLPENVRLIIAGADPTKQIRALAGDRVEVPGRVDDLAPLFERSRVFVAPLRYGAGVKGKIYSAFAHGVPVVTTTTGSEGMGLSRGRQALVGDDAASFTEAVTSLYTDPAAWKSLSDSGLKFVRQRAGLGAGMAAMSEALNLARLSRSQ